MSVEVRADQISIVYVSSFYDHPLGGICTYEGKTYRFTRGYDEDNVTLHEMTLRERFRKWRQRTLFGVCVGWHWHYKDGKRARWFGGRHPVWFWGALANLYYKRWPTRYPFFRWEW